MRVRHASLLSIVIPRCWVCAWEIRGFPAGPAQNFSRKYFPTPKIISKKLFRKIFKNFPAQPKNFYKKNSGNFPGRDLGKSATQPINLYAVNPTGKQPFRTPIFPDPHPPKSGPCTAPDSPLFRNGALYAPGLGSADPLLYAKLLEVFGRQGVRRIIYDAEGDFTSENIPAKYLRRDALRETPFSVGD